MMEIKLRAVINELKKYYVAHDFDVYVECRDANRTIDNVCIKCLLEKKWIKYDIQCDDTYETDFKTELVDYIERGETLISHWKRDGFKWEEQQAIVDVFKETLSVLEEKGLY